MHDPGPGGHESACETTIGEQTRANIHARGGTDEAPFVRMREARDRTLSMPASMLRSVQTNIRAGAPPPAEGNGTRYLRIPPDTL